MKKVWDKKINELCIVKPEEGIRWYHQAYWAKTLVVTLNDMKIENEIFLILKDIW